MSETIGMPVLLAIDFDDQSILQTSEVCEVRTQRDLSTEVSPGER